MIKKLRKTEIAFGKLKSNITIQYASGIKITLYYKPLPTEYYKQ
jgi:hypothetical protein